MNKEYYLVTGDWDGLILHLTVLKGHPTIKCETEEDCRKYINECYPNIKILKIEEKRK